MCDRLLSESSFVAKYQRGLEGAANATHKAGWSGVTAYYTEKTAVVQQRAWVFLCSYFWSFQTLCCRRGEPCLQRSIGWWGESTLCAHSVL